MLRVNTIKLLDHDERRRAHICHQLNSPQLFVSPYACVDELRPPSDSRTIYLVHDDGNLLEEAMDRIASFKAWMPVIAYSGGATPGRVVHAVFAGAIDYLDANFSPAELRESIAKATARTELMRAAREVTIRARSNMEQLSQREREVISALSDGLTNKGIAQRLNISPRTVELHRTHALGKLGAANSCDAVRIALEAKLPGTN